MVARETAHEHFGWRSVVGRVLAKTSILLMIMTAIDIVASYAEPPARFQHLIDIGFTIAFALQGAFWARELILALIARKIGARESETTLANATNIIRVLISVTLFAIAIILILDNLGVNVTALVAGLGIGGIAIGLAAQGIFSDLFAALSILFDKPFKPGDSSSYDQPPGTVERIGLKTTRLRSMNGEQLIMANTKLLEREIHNLAGGRRAVSRSPSAVVDQTLRDELEKVGSIAKSAVNCAKAAISCAAPSAALRHRASISSCSTIPARPTRTRSRPTAASRSRSFAPLRSTASNSLSDAGHLHCRARRHDGHALSGPGGLIRRPALRRAARRQGRSRARRACAANSRS